MMNMQKGRGCQLRTGRPSLVRVKGSGWGKGVSLHRKTIRVEGKKRQPLCINKKKKKGARKTTGETPGRGKKNSANWGKRGKLALARAFNASFKGKKGEGNRKEGKDQICWKHQRQEKSEFPLKQRIEQRCDRRKEAY